MIKVAEIEAAAYHRNGVSGVGFYVGIVGASAHGEPPHPFLVVGFGDPDADSGDPDKVAWGDNPCIAAFDLDLLKQHVVDFGQNSWRGDHFVGAMDAIVEAVDAAWARRARS